jgi:hypothetical protein
VTPTATSSDTKRDAALIGAVDVARAAAVDEVGEAMVGDHLSAVMEAERVATHQFTCTNPAYLGWRWSVTIARAPRSKTITVDEVVLLPGPDALTSPEWVPWSERVRPGDLGPGDVLPSAPDDPRLVPGYIGEDDLESLASLSPLHPGQWEIGLGRVRVLSLQGRDDAVDRWIEGDFGPATPMARQSARECSTCGFMLALGGPIGQAFALCANDMSPADGRVVALAFGCGAHSEVEAEAEPRLQAATDEMSWDPLELGHS